ncbi:hypothetical protein I5M27_06410 [Adhaeribacter sp. BT258]|uniref:Cytochrome c-type biogenesis protein n=1 Tax=Adhaeribacter terrigena TaxID=2793070 RepID=A0ABS1BZM3_9BACT|nr:hypothetical protein [Adhaeribacter terrigena]MBK0402610.1 hypothetical protein [Adhaeribacter terrigena]
MRTIANKFIFGFLFLFLSWKGLDGLLINYHSQQQYEVNILELEKTGTQHKRFLKINNGIAADPMIYFEENPGSPIDVVYPIISANQMMDARLGKPVEARVLVKIKNMSRECLEDGNCFLPDSTSISGITENDLLNFTKDQYQLLEEDGLKIAKDAILVEANTKPIPLAWNLLMFIGGSSFAFAILKSFFRKADNLEDYWEKVTEKKMA